MSFLTANQNLEFIGYCHEQAVLKLENGHESERTSETLTEDKRYDDYAENRDDASITNMK